MSATREITAAKLTRRDYYRAQVYVDPMTWAGGYNAIADFDPELAARVRDKFAAAVTKVATEHFRTLWATAEFRVWYRQWSRETAKVDADPRVQREFQRWLVDTVGIVI